MDNEYSTREVRFVGDGGDAGVIYEVTCPICKRVVQCADYGWWDPVCDCGVRWSVDIVATGVKE